MNLTGIILTMTTRIASVTRLAATVEVTTKVAFIPVQDTGLMPIIVPATTSGQLYILALQMVYFAFHIFAIETKNFVLAPQSLAPALQIFEFELQILVTAAQVSIMLTVAYFGSE